MQTIHPHTDGVIQQSADISAAYQFRMQSLQLQMRQAFRRQHLLLFALAVLLLGGGIAIFQSWHIAAIVPGLAACFCCAASSHFASIWLRTPGSVNGMSVASPA